MMPRASRLSPATFTLVVAGAAVFIVSAADVAPSVTRLAEGVPRIGNLTDRMTPPNLEPAFLSRIGLRLIETFQIALVGTVFGILLSLPIAWLSARRLSPIGPVRFLFKALVSLFRTVPDLVWALIFVSAVGLGAMAGTLTVIVDTIGFCGRFFAEAMEDADREPQEALSAIGANRFSILCGGVLPDILPSMINTALFALEKAVRSSVVLGLVGAGGIGQELKVAFDLFQYHNASTIILAIFGLVLIMETVSDRLRTLLE